MCGIAGLIGPGASLEAVERMAAALAHRGPDDAGTWIGPDVALAHTRLAILDLSPRESALLVPLVVLTIYYGIHPAPVLDAFAASTDALLKSTQAALGAAKTAALVSP